MCVRVCACVCVFLCARVHVREVGSCRVHTLYLNREGDGSASAALNQDLVAISIHGHTNPRGDVGGARGRNRHSGRGQI